MRVTLAFKLPVQWRPEVLRLNIRSPHFSRLNGGGHYGGGKNGHGGGSGGNDSKKSRSNGWADEPNRSATSPLILFAGASTSSLNDYPAWNSDSVGAFFDELVGAFRQEQQKEAPAFVQWIVENDLLTSVALGYFAGLAGSTLMQGSTFRLICFATLLLKSHHYGYLTIDLERADDDFGKWLGLRRNPLNAEGITGLRTMRALFSKDGFRIAERTISRKVHKYPAKFILMTVGFAFGVGSGARA